MRPYLRLVRVGNVGVSLLGTVVGGLVARGAGLSVPTGGLLVILLAALSTACVTAAGNVLNDLGDRESDKVNHPERPLVTGEISPGSARALMAGLFGASVVLVLPFVLAYPSLAGILGLALAALLLYERRLKSSGLPGNALVAFLTAAVFLYGGAAGGNVVLLLPFAAMAFLATLSREVIKDMEDAGGDVDRRTLPRVRGMAAATVVARSSVALAIGLSPLPFVSFLSLTSVVGLIYLALVVIVDGLFVASVATLPSDPHREQGLSKAAMTVALLAFLASAFR